MKRVIVMAVYWFSKRFQIQPKLALGRIGVVCVIVEITLTSLPPICEEDLYNLVAVWQKKEELKAILKINL